MKITAKCPAQAVLTLQESGLFFLFFLFSFFFLIQISSEKVAALASVQGVGVQRGRCQVSGPGERAASDARGQWCFATCCGSLLQSRPPGSAEIPRPVFRHFLPSSLSVFLSPAFLFAFPLYHPDTAFCSFFPAFNLFDKAKMYHMEYH